MSGPTLDLAGRRTAVAEALAGLADRVNTYPTEATYPGQETLAEGTTPALTVHRTWPARLAPPAVLVTEGSPFVTGEAEGLPFGHVRIRWQLDVVAERGDNAWMTDALDELAAATWDELAEAAGTTYALAEVGQFYTLEANGTAYLAARLVVTEDTPA